MTAPKTQRPGPTRLATAVAILCLAAPWQARASDEGPVALTGTWSYADVPEEVQLRRKAVEAATERVPRFARESARQRLLERTTPPRELELRVAGDRFDLGRDGDEVSLTLGGQPVTVEKNGRRGRLSARLDGAQLLVKSEGENGQSETRYALSADGTRLTVSVRMTGERLSRPLEYRSTYRLNQPP